MSRLINFRRMTVGLAMFAVILMSSAMVARADSTQITLSQLNIAGFTGPFATVDINRTSLTTATITFTGLTNGGFTYLIGGGQAADLNFNGGPVTFSTPTFTGGCTGGGCPAGGTAFTSSGAGNADGWGTFNFRLDDNDGFQDAVSSLTFDVECLSCNWTNASLVLAPNGDGHVAAAHIFVANLNGTNTGFTGFATNGIPEPTTMLLLGSGLMGVAATLRRRSRIKRE